MLRHDAMRPHSGLILKAVILSLALLPGRGMAQATDEKREAAEKLYRAGQFAEAEKLYREFAAKEPVPDWAALRLGQIATFSNRLDDAEKWVQKAIELAPDEKPRKALLAEIYYRRNDFARAAALLREAGREAKAKKLESFGDAKPYELQAKTDVTRLKFVLTDPLPVVEVRVNGGDPVNFLIDTGAGEVYLDPEFAKSVGVQLFGGETGTFAGGAQAQVQEGRVNALTLGEFTVRNVPVTVLDTRRFTGITRGKRIDGILGTVLFYRFLATLDYRNEELVLRRKTQKVHAAWQKEIAAGHPIEMPFWLVGDHFMLAWGKVNDAGPMLFFVDTGLAGGGFTCPESTLKEAGITPDESQAGEGIGGGGRVRVVPFSVARLSLGEATEQNIRGMFSGAFPLENVFGFRVGGIISHQFFRPYALTFDFMAMKLVLEPKQ
jgi:tetratricopeptide (TPR) repeat protein